MGSASKDSQEPALAALLSELQELPVSRQVPLAWVPWSASALVLLSSVREQQAQASRDLVTEFQLVRSLTEFQSAASPRVCPD
jgi:hypothetical protein